MFSIFVELNAKPDTAAEVEGILRALAAGAGDEPGNVVYAVNRRQETAAEFLLYECYRDRAAFDAHLALPPVQAALQRFETLLTAPPRIVACDTVASSAVR